MEDVPLKITCPYCLHERQETLQRALAGKLFPPLWCTSCGRNLELDWQWIEARAKELGLWPPKG
ncbi:hypothetical protein [Burkholderia ubonensis]|uniref:hypothetical protein n=1 Tax=Burkholderia ubonensis TaxID=101571 RepID=UPI0012FBC2FC|nr:hypothetical protein [Burkholderia ubonensis]